MGEKVAGFIWYDLMTNDVEAAARFYGAVFG
jgi:predicted enzyme related to lactoylglutathione lyase